MNSALATLVEVRGVPTEVAVQEYDQYTGQGFAYCKETACFYKKEAPTRLIIVMPVKSSLCSCGCKGYESISVEISPEGRVFVGFFKRKETQVPVDDVGFLLGFFHDYRISARMLEGAFVSFKLDF